MSRAKPVGYYNGEWAHGAAACKRLFAKADADAASGPRRSAVRPTYVILSHQILANALMKHDEITLAFFAELARGVWRAIPEAAVCATNRYLSCALEDYPTMFERRGECSLGRAPGSAERFTQEEVDFWFNDEMPDSIRSKFKQYFERLTP
jgi:hypothetical protein